MIFFVNNLVISQKEGVRNFVHHHSRQTYGLFTKIFSDLRLLKLLKTDCRVANIWFDLRQTYGLSHNMKRSISADTKLSFLFLLTSNLQ
jgi:hypothetical protein